MNSLILISPDRALGFQPILSGKSSLVNFFGTAKKIATVEFFCRDRHSC
jgi:hypothetical protein